jgi:hypothetical protein
MERKGRLHKKHRFRMMLCGHKAVETAAVCLVLMVQGQLAQATATHFLIASETGLLTIFPLVGITWTRHARHYTNRWITAAFVSICAFAADALIHRSHYPGEYTEAALTALGAGVLSLVISYTPLGKRIDHLAETFR